MKNKNLLYVIGAIAIVAIILVFATGGSKSGVQTASNPAGAMSMKDLLASGASQKCTFTNNSAEANTSGVIYATQGHMRGDFTSVAVGNTTQSHMITDGQVSYVWTDQMAQGFKTSFSSPTSQGSGSSGVNPDEKVNYSCSPWSVDQGEFSLPANITFSDMNALMNPGAGANTGAGTSAGTELGNSAQCSLCAQAPTATAQAQCRAALGCK